MKKFFTLLVMMVMAILIYAQAPQKLNYQAVIRNSSGQLVTNHAVGMKISILQGSATGTVVYSETYSPVPQTNANGLVIIEIGSGVPATGIFTSINWGGGTYYLKTEIDPAGGTNYTVVGTSRLLSVPYSLFSKEAGTATNAVTLNGDQTISGTKTFGSDILVNGLTVGKGGNAITSNTVCGYQALGAITWGADNTAFGYQALHSLTGSYYNTAIGSAALKNNTGPGNTAIGCNALSLNTGGNYNTATGLYALYKNTTAGSNTAYGVQSLYENTTGSFNTAYGTSSLKSNKTGNFNTAVGNFALSANTTASKNVAVGNHALFDNTTGYENVAIGDSALSSNIDGQWNTAIGSKSCYQFQNKPGHVHGYGITTIGAYSNVYSDGLYNATALGYYAYVNASNKVRIGDNRITVIEGKVNWSVGSDIRLKENIRYSDELGLKFINSLETVTFTYKDDPQKRHHDGLIAQDVQSSLESLGLKFSGLAENENEEKILNLSYAEFVIPLINSVKELSRINQEQQKQIDELTAIINTLNEK